jgi:antitoxin VapB
MSLETIEINDDKGVQAIMIPKELRIDDTKVYLKKVGNTLFIIPFHNPWKNLIESTDSFTTDFMENRNQPEPQTREFFE